MDAELSHTPANANDYADLYPRFHADRDGNIIAYANGNATTIVNGNRRADRYTITDANGSTTDSDTDPHGNQYADDTAITRDGTEPTGHTSHDNHTAALVDPDANGGV